MTVTAPTLPIRLGKGVARTPRELARWPWALPRRAPGEAGEYLAEHVTDWSTVAEASPEDAADILEAIGEQAAGGLISYLEPDQAAELFAQARNNRTTSPMAIRYQPNTARE